jgi:hypothetical protein
MLRCTECGGTNLKMAYWLDPNTKEIIEPVYENLDEGCAFLAEQKQS